MGDLGVAAAKYIYLKKFKKKKKKKRRESSTEL